MRRTFASVSLEKEPKEDLLIPIDVKCAKHLRYEMTERADRKVMDDKPSNTFLLLNEENARAGSTEEIEAFHTVAAKDAENITPGGHLQLETSVIYGDGEDLRYRSAPR